MKLLDTVVIVGALNPDDRRHKRASVYLDKLSKDPLVKVPVFTLLEFDLLTKVRGYTEEERVTTWLEVSSKIPSEKVAPLGPAVFARASGLQRQGLSYFDSLVSALALELRATVITDDKTIASVVSSEW